ncbi:hypothetical protein SAMN06273567_102276 [Geodermatophilus aquaeductus]|uniref:Uncharacterized protein n=1 Tax=Geodermatophilus aquaeductus TaxID=1564161 RepID=A0A521CCC2_9ACTN|nr:hypothetical protein SAMN06273567_102276 [Geodermatophilus aquaeductus]
MRHVRVVFVAYLLTVFGGVAYCVVLALLGR